MLRQIFERGRLILEAALDQDVAFTIVQGLQRGGQQGPASGHFLAIADAFFLALLIIDQPILPFALAIHADRRVQAMIGCGEAAVHAHHVLLGHTEHAGDLGHLFGLHVTVLDRLHLPLQAAQVEEQFFLRGRGAHFHQRPGMQDIFLDRGADPPHRIGCQAETAFRIKPLDRLHHADIALGDQLAEWQAIAAVAHRDFRHQAQMRGH